MILILTAVKMEMKLQGLCVWENWLTGGILVSDMIVYESLVLLYLYNLCRIDIMFMVNFTQGYSVRQNLRYDMS